MRITGWRPESGGRGRDWRLVRVRDGIPKSLLTPDGAPRLFRTRDKARKTAASLNIEEDEINAAAIAEKR